jgi:hypothetical protein
MAHINLYYQLVEVKKGYEKKVTSYENRSYYCRPSQPLTLHAISKDTGLMIRSSSFFIQYVSLWNFQTSTVV